MASLTPWPASGLMPSHRGLLSPQGHRSGGGPQQHSTVQGPAGAYEVRARGARAGGAWGPPPWRGVRWRTRRHQVRPASTSPSGFIRSPALQGTVPVLAVSGGLPRGRGWGEAPHRVSVDLSLGRKSLWVKAPGLDPSTIGEPPPPEVHHGRVFSERKQRRCRPVILLYKRQKPQTGDRSDSACSFPPLVT